MYEQRKSQKSIYDLRKYFNCIKYFIMANLSNSQNISNWIRFNNKKWIRRDANSDFAEIVFGSNNNDDTTFDFKLWDDWSEWFRFLYNNSWRTSWDHNRATFKQTLFAHAQFGEFPLISLAIWDSDTGFNWESDWVIQYFANWNNIQKFSSSLIPVVAEDLWFNVKIKKLTQTQYDALWNWTDNSTLYIIVD